MESDVMYKLEKGTDDRQVAKESRPQLKALYSLQDRSRDDYAANQALRKAFRSQKRKLAALDAEGAALNLGIPLLPESEADSKHIPHVVFHPGNSSRDKARRIARLKLHTGSVFGDTRSAVERQSERSRAHQLRLKALEKQIEIGTSRKQPKRRKRRSSSKSNSFTGGGADHRIPEIRISTPASATSTTNDTAPDKARFRPLVGYSSSSEDSDDSD